MIGPEPVESPSGRPLAEAAAALATLIDTSAYVGEVYSLGYNDALVQIHDHHRALVGGIPALSFLVATRIIDPVISTRPGKTPASSCFASSTRRICPTRPKPCGYG